MVHFFYSVIVVLASSLGLARCEKAKNTPDKSTKFHKIEEIVKVPKLSHKI